MSLRASLAAVTVVVVTLFVVGCARTSAPTGPSASAWSPSSPSSSSLGSSSTSSSVQSTGSIDRLLAQLRIVGNFLVASNQIWNGILKYDHAVTLPPSVPQETAGGRSAEEIAHDFYLRANAALDLVAPSLPSPLSEPATDLLNAISEQANITLGLLVNLPPEPPPPPSVPETIKAAQRIILVANFLLSCKTAPCVPPVQ